MPFIGHNLMFRFLESDSKEDMDSTFDSETSDIKMTWGVIKGRRRVLSDLIC